MYKIESGRRAENEGDQQFTWVWNGEIIKGREEEEEEDDEGEGGENREENKVK